MSENIVKETVESSEKIKILEDISGNIIQLVCFTVDEEVYGLEILKIQEIVRMPEITRLPKAAVFIKGVINLRGNIIPVIDLREKFGLPAKRYTKMTRAIVVEIEGKKIALIVDEVSNVLRIPEKEISTPPSFVSNVAREYIESVARHEEELIIILKIDQILSSDEIIELEKIS